MKVTAPSLTLDKSVAAGQDPYIQSGQTVTFDLTVTNTGDTTLTSVPLADTWDDTNLNYTSLRLAARGAGRRAPRRGTSGRWARRLAHRRSWL